MPFPVQLLLTRLQCEEALTKLRLERRVFTVQDTVLDLRTDQATGRATDRATELAEAQATVAQLTPLIASMSPTTAGYAVLSKSLRTAARRVEDLTSAPAKAADPVTAFQKAVDAEQAAAQLPVLDAAIAAVEAHRDSLPA